MKKTGIVALALAVTLSGCAIQSNTGKGAAYGTAGGAAAGALLGQIIGQNTQGTLLGAAAGKQTGCHAKCGEKSNPFFHIHSSSLEAVRQIAAFCLVDIRINHQKRKVCCFDNILVIS